MRSGADNAPLSGPFTRPLGERLSNRDNNLNLIRATAAWAVLVSHAWPLALGGDAVQPLEGTLGYPLGWVAVLVFFAASGYLITSSYARTPDLGTFLRARSARLMPGLAVSLLIVALVIGPMVSDLPASTYLSRPETWTFLSANILLFKIQFDLPGVFTTNPYPAVEGSLWTLFYEVVCYGGVVLAGVTGLLRRRGAATLVLVAWLLGSGYADGSGIRTFYQLDQIFALSQPFVVGMLLFLWRDRVPANPLLLAALAAAAWAAGGTWAWPLFLNLAIGYGTILLAVWPAGAVRRYNRLGDYSYGIYIYAFPMQGLAVWAFGPMTPMQNILLSVPPTLVLAMLSWHLIERPALDWARRSRRRGAMAAARGNEG